MRAGPAAVSALAAVALALALQISSGMYDVRALALAVLAASGAAAAAFWFSDREDPLVARAVLGGGAAAGLLFHLFAEPTFYGERSALGGFHWLAATALVLLSAYLCVHLRASLVRARFLLLLACFLAMGIAVLRSSPRPWVDVWVFQQGATDALLHGFNPFAVSYPDIYGRLSSQMYSPEVAYGGRVFAFPYPPLSILAALPGFALFGDMRFSWLLAMAGGAWLVARSIGGVSGELAALFMLFQPRSFFVLEQAWTEPLVLAALALALLACVRGWRPWLAGLAFGALLASKQYAFMVGLPLLLVLPARARLRAGLVAVASAAAVTLPFALWDPAGFVRGVVRLQFVQPFRADGLSLLSAWARAGGRVPEGAGLLAPALGLTLLLLWGVWTKKKLFFFRPGPALGAGALVWVAVVLFSKQGFCNYYWLCVALLAGASAAKAERLGEAA